MGVEAGAGCLLGGSPATLPPRGPHRGPALHPNSPQPRAGCGVAHPQLQRVLVVRAGCEVGVDTGPAAEGAAVGWTTLLQPQAVPVAAPGAGNVAACGGEGDQDGASCRVRGRCPAGTRLTAGQLAADRWVPVFLHLQVRQGHLFVARLLGAASWGQGAQGPLLLHVSLLRGPGSGQGRGSCLPPAQAPPLTFPSASAFTAILPILRFMVREMTARHFLLSFIPLLRAASSGMELLDSSSGIWQRDEE